MAISPKDRYPIIIVTGANSGLGLAICQRLLAQISRSCPEDALPKPSSGKEPMYQHPRPSPFAPTTRVTLVLACRDLDRATAARQLLLEFMDEEVLRQHGHAEELRRGLRIDCIRLDLANMESIFDFAEEASRRYSYVTHIILNAGLLCGTSIDYWALLKQFLTDPIATLTTPKFVRQKIAAESVDGLGLVWQSNVFGHYSLSRLLEPLLLQNPYLDSRVEWMSSLDADRSEYDPTDPQLLRAKFSYQASKYQVDLLGTTLARARSQGSPSNETAHIRHLLVHPGVCRTNIAVSLKGVFLAMMECVLFYLIRVLGSTNHGINPYKGAVSATHVALAPSSSLVITDPPQKYGSKATVWGKEYVGMDAILDLGDNATEGEILLKYCEKFFSMFKVRRGFPFPSKSDSGSSFPKDTLDN